MERDEAQKVTVSKWWDKRRDAFELYISQLVVDETKAGDPVAARDRIKLMKDLPILDITPEVGLLATSLLASGVIPQRAATDAGHIAIAAAHGLDFLMAWNCMHIANASITKAVASICEQHGLECPVICTPEELLGE